MSDKPAAATEKKPAPADDKKPAAAAAAKAGGGLLAKTPVVVAAVMVVEAVVLFAGVKFLGGGPRNAGAEVSLVDAAAAEKGRGPAAPGDGDHKGGVEKDAVEVPVVDIRAPNKVSGRTFLYDVSIFAVCRADAADKVKGLISARDALIKDRVRTIIAEMDPDKLGGGSEPGLETLRRQVKFQLDQICGDGLIQTVLVPRCMPFRTDY